MNTSIVSDTDGLEQLLGKHCPDFEDGFPTECVLIGMHELQSAVWLLEGAFEWINEKLASVYDDPDAHAETRRIMREATDRATGGECEALKLHEKLKLRQAVMEHARWMPAYVQESAASDEPGASSRDKAHAEAIREQIADIKAMLEWLRGASNDSFLNAQALPLPHVTKDVAEHLVVGMTTCVDSALDMVDTSIGELERLIGNDGTDINEDNRTGGA